MIIHKTLMIAIMVLTLTIAYSSDENLGVDLETPAASSPGAELAQSAEVPSSPPTYSADEALDPESPNSDVPVAEHESASEYDDSWN